MHLTALSAGAAVNVSRSVDNGNLCPIYDIVFLQQETTIDKISIKSSSALELISIPLKFFGIGKPQVGLKCIKNIFLANRIPYTIEVSACNSLGCGKPRIARVGPPNDITKQDISSTWKNLSEINIAAKLTRPEDAYVDKAEVTWSWKPPSSIFFETPWRLFVDTICFLKRSNIAQMGN